MIGVDTNVLVRYLAQDHPEQSRAATSFIEQELSELETGYVSLVVLVELCWVLDRLYAATPAEVVDTVIEMLSSPQLEFQEREPVQAAIEKRRSRRSAKSVLPDQLITELALSVGCSRVMTFDKMAVRDAGMTQLALRPKT